MRGLAFGLLFPLLPVGACTPDVAFPSQGSTWQTPPPPQWSHQPRFAITDNGDDTIAFVSQVRPVPSTLGLVPVGDIPVELEGPHHLAASPDGHYLYVGLSNYVPGSGTGPHGSHGLGTVPGSLLKLDASDGRRVAEVPVDRSPGDVILTRDGKTAIVTHYDLIAFNKQLSDGSAESNGWSTIAIVDTTSMARPAIVPVCATGHGLALSNDERLLVVACSQVDQIAVVELATRKVHRLSVGPGPGAPGQPRYFPYAVTHSPADDSFWISCNGAPNGWAGVRVYDARLDAMDDARKVPLPGAAYFSAFLSDGKTLVVPHQGDDKLSIVDTSATPPALVGDDIALPAKACLNAHVAIVTPDDQYAYVVCEGDHSTIKGTVVAVNLPARAVAGYAQVGLFPDGIVPLPPAP